jgi:SagB-type dehydrogenase family enzyme
MSGFRTWGQIAFIQHLNGIRVDGEIFGQLKKKKGSSLILSSNAISEQVRIAEFVHSYSERTRLLSISPGSEPAYWDDIHIKAYDRMPLVKLPVPHLRLPVSLGTALLRRTSATLGFSKAQLSAMELSALLRWSCGMRPSPGLKGIHRVYPSAGARYPVEVYPAVIRCSRIPRGLFHYSHTKHSLEHLLDRDITQAIVRATSDHRVASAGVVIILTGVFGRTVEKYGARGLRYVLIEAGHVAQNLALVATSLGLASYSIGGFVDSEIEELLDIQNELEDPLCLFAVGRPPQ